MNHHSNCHKATSDNWLRESGRSISESQYETVRQIHVRQIHSPVDCAAFARLLLVAYDHRGRVGFTCRSPLVRSYFTNRRQSPFRSFNFTYLYRFYGGPRARRAAVPDDTFLPEAL